MKKPTTKFSVSDKLKWIIPFILLFMSFTIKELRAQEINQTIYDSVRNREVLIDFVTKEGLQTGEFAEYFQDEYQAYIPEEKIITDLKLKLNHFEIVIVLGSWCYDSKIQVPHFLKILDATAYPEENLLMIAVDSKKQASGLDITAYDIERVPTFIIYKEGQEIGRIIESPLQSLEADLQKILEQ